jgi:8-oxo-dGTP pyrophosphatase MutT (NUDIX family)
VSDSFAIVRRETILRSFVFDVERRSVSHGEEEFNRDVAVHPGAVAIVAVDHDNRVALLRQYRATVDLVLWEIPAGTIDASDLDPLATAQRELKEEIGVHANQWERVAMVYVSPGWTDQIMYIFLARDLRNVGREPDGPEEHSAEILWLTRDDVIQLLDRDNTNDATLTIGLRHYLASHE